MTDPVFPQPGTDKRLSRRAVLTGLAAVGSLGAFSGFIEPPRFNVPNPKVVPYRGRARAGSVVVDTGAKRLYLVMDGGQAREYVIAVGKAGRAFRGNGRIGRKAEWPSWTPTKNMVRREPDKYAKYAGGVPGGPNNPLGARALYLYKGSRDTMYRIHGTNNPASVGRAVSNGCIRLVNDHVKDLYARVRVGARVYVQ
ncbi:L,D-transpeptidase [Acuticoccus sp. MNP-M23]|uniref:L,D-transpeptidase n=1 Tax=Acuticoccus sp. MNP-M23 TaxID=3072793 RepID=UPI002815A0A4|nr:L,D-transpeptidase [Acuticoccus sp. MNP-M23]WMS44480.1 L,D-transpeptidase [Acuticoccus sp. MNP-M23]